MKIFQKLLEVSHSTNLLDAFLFENMHTLNEFYNSDFACIADSRDLIEQFMLSNVKILHELDYSKTYNRAFVLILLDFCERFNFIACTPIIYYLFEQNGIRIGLRLQAALLFLYPKPTSNSELVDRFDCICERIQGAIEIEEDSDKKAIATFLSYYAVIINDTRLVFAEQARTKIKHAVDNHLYAFLSNSIVGEALSFDLLDSQLAFVQIQQLVDKVLNKNIKDHISQFDYEDIIIEEGTTYVNELNKVHASFNSIRRISVDRSDGKAFTNRGVKILESETELYGYLRRFGNMHEAKIKHALSCLPHTFVKKVNVVDWGCGQGLASMVLLDKYGSQPFNDIVLIEPSEVALKRAALHVSKYEPRLPIRTVCKKLDDLTERDLANKKAGITIHLFSNILDIDDYSLAKLTELIVKSQLGNNYFVCASPYIDDIKTDKLDSFRRFFEKSIPSSFNLLLEETTTKSTEDEFWLCNNNKDKTHITHGGFLNCNEYSKTGGCSNKWTRVIRVFTITL